MADEVYHLLSATNTSFGLNFNLDFTMDIRPEDMFWHSNNVFIIEKHRIVTLPADGTGDVATVPNLSAIQSKYK